MQVFVAWNKLSQNLWDIHNPKTSNSQSQWPRGLSRWSAVTRLLEILVRILPGRRRLSLVSVVCYKAEVSATSRSLIQRSPTKCSVSKYDRETSIIKRLFPTWGCCTTEVGQTLSSTYVQSLSPRHCFPYNHISFFRIIKALNTLKGPG
jgi:hypothetical protein